MDAFPHGCSFGGGRAPSSSRRTLLGFCLLFILEGLSRWFLDGQPSRSPLTPPAPCSKGGSVGAGAVGASGRAEAAQKRGQEFSLAPASCGKGQGAAAQLWGLGRQEGGLEGTQRQKSAGKIPSRSPPPAPGGAQT